MRFLIPNYLQNGPGVDRNAPKKTGIPLFIETFTREFTTLLKLNFIFVLCCIPIITIGPAIGAMTSVTVKMVKDEPSDIYYDFKQSFKKNFKQSFILGLLGVLFIAAMTCAFLFYIQLEGISYYCMMLIIFGTGIFVLCAGLYMYPMAVSVNLKISQIIKNSFILAIMSIKNSLIALFLCGIMLACGYMFRVLTIPIIFLFCSFSFCSFISSFCAWGAIEKNIIK